MRTDVVRFYAACSVAEICDALCPEGAENESLFVAAAETLRSLAYGKETCAEAICSFLLTALFESGYMIDLDGCGACGREIGGEKTEDVFRFFEGRFCATNAARLQNRRYGERERGGKHARRIGAGKREHILIFAEMRRKFR